MHRHRRRTGRPRPGRFWLALALVLAAAATWVGVACLEGRPVANPGGGALPPPPPPPPPPVPCPLCGTVWPAGTRVEWRPIMVILDNHPAARPQAGISQACLVFEVLAEGGITRLAPVFACGDPPRLGPVRSVRHYFLDLVLGLDAMIAHCGESPRAAEEIRRFRVADLDAFEHDPAYWRDDARRSPHNLFTSVARLRAAAERAGLAVTRRPEVRWPYALASASEAAPKGQASTGVEVTWPFSAGKYTSSFHYQPATATAPAHYERRINGAPHLDEETGLPMRAANVVVVYARFTRIPGDAEGRLDANLTGTGRATVLRQGVAYDLTWRKLDRTSPLVLVDPEGRPARLDPGQTWILMVPDAGATVRLLRPAS